MAPSLVSRGASNIPWEVGLRKATLLCAFPLPRLPLVSIPSLVSVPPFNYLEYLKSDLMM